MTGPHDPAVTAASALPAGGVALVTGASRGIGRAIARRLAAQGAAVVVHASPRSRAGLDETVALVRAAGGRAAAVAADLADAGARAGLLAAAAEPFGPVTVLVNNAAANPAYAPPSRIDLAARQAGFEINFHAPVDLCQQALPAMKAAGWGRIVNLSSEMAQQPPIPYPGPAKLVHGLVLYGAAKAALERYTQGLAAELHGSGVTANALLPVKIALSESAEAVARQVGASNPHWVEPLEMMAEAAWLLVSGRYNGLVTNSRAMLQLAQSPLHALDGRTVIGDALSLASFA
ncbi:2-ketogluconate reductase [Solimonas fluminis]|uniref:2-ketogluconate reductase n=1 Tax=Solimonas fluminis TaxID=2086571 RepID=A0A2S5TGU0_9GAMM|nr:2-ketogluconate reductase [Solimonas fluminis]